MNRHLTVAAIVLGLSLAVASASAATDPSAPVVARSRMELPLGLPAPEILATELDGHPAALATMKGKPVVLEFASITDPMFRMRVAAVEKLAEKYRDKVNFVILYQREAHPADTDRAIPENETEGYGIAAPTTMKERYKLAEMARDRLHIKNEKILVDAWSNTSSLRYGGYPNMTFVIDAKGMLVAGYPWMDPHKVQGALEAVLAGKTVPEYLRGPVHISSREELAGNNMEMMGYGPGQKLAVVLDDIKMTDDQKQAIIPPLTQFMADLRDFRQTRGEIGQPAKNKEGKGEAKKAPKAAGEPDSSGVKVVTADDLQAAIQKLRTDAHKLRDIIKKNLSEADANRVIDAMSKGPARRLFADE